MRYLLLALLPLAAAAEPVKVVAVDRKDPVTYDKDVEPILGSKCAACHSGNVKKGRLDLGSYDTLLKGGKHGNPVAAGHAADSLLYKAAGRTAKPAMPPD